MCPARRACTSRCGQPARLTPRPRGVRAGQNKADAGPFAERILVLLPHPDDEVVGVATFIDDAVRQGCGVRVAFLTDGVPAIDVVWPWQRRHRAQRMALRGREAARAQQALGYEVALAQHLPTRALRHHLGSTLAALISVIERDDIACVWAPAYEGGHQDHDAANYLANLLVATVPVWEFSEYHFAHRRVICNQFIESQGTERALALDATQRARKQQLLQLYNSERGNLSYVTLVEEQMRPLCAYNYALPPHRGRTFYQRFQWVPRHPRIDYTTPAEVSTSLTQFDAQHLCRSSSR